MNRSISITCIFIFFIVSGLRAQPVDTLFLPDGTPFESWDDETVYTQVYHVNQNHPAASDENPGTPEEPFKTINKAAQILKSGEKVIVYSGVYREQIQPVNEGIAKDKMISYEVAPGNKVVVKGSLVFNEQWIVSRDTSGSEWVHNVWQAPLDSNIFAPFYVQNASDEEIDLMPWALRWKGRVPYTLGRGLIFQAGKRMRQLAMLEDIAFVQGTYWVDKERKLIHIHPFDNVDPNAHVFELTHLQQLVVPADKALSYIRISGFIFEHAGNGYPRVGTGAVFVKGGYYWIIENNTVRECGSVGIEIGARIAESAASTGEENQRVQYHTGGFIVRNNHVYECGTGGIEGHTVINSILEGNHIHHIGWQQVERYWECAGIKVLRNQNVVAVNNEIHDIREASAIWFDWDNRNCRITGNLIYDIDKTSNGAIFIEASIAPNMVDNNLVWNVQGPGVSLYDTDSGIVCHNIVAFTNMAISSRINTQRSLEGRPLTSKNNTIKNNIFYRNRAQLVIEDKENVSDHNIFAWDDLKLQQDAGFDENSHQINLTLEWFPDDKEIAMTTSAVLPVVPLLPYCKIDFWRNLRPEESVLPGLWNVITIGKAGFLLKFQ